MTDQLGAIQSVTESGDPNLTDQADQQNQSIGSGLVNDINGISAHKEVNDGNEITMQVSGQFTTATNKSELGSDLAVSHLNQGVKNQIPIEQQKFPNLVLEEEKDSSGEDPDDLDNMGDETSRQFRDGNRSPRSKFKKKQKATSRANSKKAQQSLFKETESVMMKKQEKFQFNQEGVKGWNRAIPPTGQVSVMKLNRGPQMRQSPSQMRLIGSKTSNHSSIQIGTAVDRSNIGSIRLGSQLRTGGSKLYVSKNKQGGSNLRLSDCDATPKDNLRNGSAPPKLDPKEQAKLDEYWRYRLDPVNDPNSAEYEPEEFPCYSRLMRKLNNIKLKAHDEHSEDNLNNSYNIEVSSISSVEEEQDPVPNDKADATPSPVKKKKPKKKKKQTVKQMMAAMFGKKDNGAAAIKRKARKPVMNVYCTDYEVVKKAAKVYAGFRLKERREDHEGAIVKGVGGQKLAEDWDVSWHDLGITADYFAKMQPYQKVNQFAGIYTITRKNNLARNLMKMKKAYPEEYRFFPRTFIMPGEASEFRNQFTDRNGRPINRRKTFIVKPDNLAQGRGIYLSRNCEKIIEQCTNEGGGWVVQDYLASPHTVEDLKYDLRIYVLLYGLNPLRIYIHEQGLARFATEPYEKPRPNNLDNIYCHLTNYAINKDNANFRQNNKQARDEDDYGAYDDEESDDYGEEEEEGHKRSMFAILKILYSQGADVDKVMGEIKDIVIKTCISGQPYMNHTYRVCQPECMDNSMCFQVLGFDIMIDKNFRPWLIEVNQSPSFSTDSPLDYEVKKAVLQDTFRLLNSSAQRREEYIRIKQEQAEERMLKGKTIKLGNEERETRRQALLEERFLFERQRINEGSGYELIYPPLGDEERESEFEAMKQKAQDIWDDFTTGKTKRRQEEAAKQAEQQKLEKRKSQPALDGQGTPGESRPPEISDSETVSSHKEEEIVAGTDELLANAVDTIQTERENNIGSNNLDERSEQQQQANIFEEEKFQIEESQGLQIKTGQIQKTITLKVDQTSPLSESRNEKRFQPIFHINSLSTNHPQRPPMPHPSNQIT